MNNTTVLVIDDEPQIRRLLQITLESNGFCVMMAADGKEGLAIAANRRPDAIILDLGLPDQSGQIVLRRLREWYTLPIIILSVQDDEVAIVAALDSGANDYLTKPFRTGELLARMRAGFRAAQGAAEQQLVEIGPLLLDLPARTLRKDGQPVKLTQTEYLLVALLMKNHGRVLTHQYLLKTIWGPTYVDQSQYLRVFVAQIRKKIEDDPNRPKLLITESGVGYRLAAT